MGVRVEKGSPGEEQIVRTACAHHCGASCIWKVHVKDGIITRLEPDDESVEPQLRGYLKGHALRQQVYAPDRLKYPLKRTSPRGSAQFERISCLDWTEKALNLACEGG